MPTPSARPPTTYGSSEPSTWSRNPGAPGATTCRPRLSAPSPLSPPIRDHVLAPLIGEIRSPRRAVSRKNWTPVEHDYERLRSGMEDLFEHLGMATAA